MRALTCVLIAVLTATAHADVADAIKAAQAAEIRTDAERARDKNRLPVETLQFFGLTQDMRVLELLPGGGWYTKLLAPVLREEGQLYLAVGTDRVRDNLLNEPGFDRVEVVPVDTEFKREGRRITIDDLSLDVKRIDLALTFRNVHNLTETGRRTMNEAVFKVLKRGGSYGVVDHTRRHMQADSDENWRRMDPVLMIKEIEAVGFEFVDFATMHYRADDELRYEVGRRSVTGNTDRFTLLFRKP